MRKLFRADTSRFVCVALNKENRPKTWRAGEPSCSLQDLRVNLFTIRRAWWSRTSSNPPPVRVNAAKRACRHSWWSSSWPSRSSWSSCRVAFVLPAW